MDTNANLKSSGAPESPAASQTVSAPLNHKQRRRAAAQIASGSRKLVKSGKAKSAISTRTARKAIDAAIKIGPLDAGQFGYLNFFGILPLELADNIKIAIIPDIHAPAHDKKVMRAIEKWLKDYQPDILILIGDVVDYYSMSAWVAAPGSVKDVNDEVETASRVVRRLMDISGAKHTYWIQGNHEDRGKRYEMNVAPTVATIINPTTREKVLDLASLLGFTDDDPITFIYDPAGRGGFGGGLLINNDKLVIHGFICRQAPGQSARAHGEKFGKSTSTGHTHKVGFVVWRTNAGEIRCSEYGYVGDEEHQDFAYSVNMNCHHKAVGVMQIVGGKVHENMHPFRPVKWNGRVVLAMVYADTVYPAVD